jgi:hypothetical protein
MSLYVNPFFARTSEQLSEVSQYVQTFGAGALDMLPEQVWDRLLILRSSPGAGKTSLMRMFAVDSLEWVSENTKPNDPLFQELAERGVLIHGRVSKLGILLNLDRDYRSLLDLPLAEEVRERLFLRLLDVRILVAAVRAALKLVNRQYPDDAHLFDLAIPEGAPQIEAMVDRVGGPTGDGILDYARKTENEILGLLDALLVTEVRDPLEGHGNLYSLSLLSGGVAVSGELLDAQPLVMFDDGHKLEPSQRTRLLDELRRRGTATARWYAERFEALSDQELLATTGEPGRDHVLVDLDDVARNGSPDSRRFQRGRHDRVLEDIARRRGTRHLASYADETQDFLELLEEDADAILGGQEAEVVGTLRAGVERLVEGERRYDSWLADARAAVGWEAAVRWRELEVLVHRDKRRHPGLFEEDLSLEESVARSSPAIREGAGLAVAKEFDLPIYGGSATLVRLASHNVEQFLTLCGDLFGEMLVDISLGRRPFLQLRRQHRVIRDASERFWESIPRTIPHGRDVQALVGEIVRIAKDEGAKPTMPYPPGVTGTAMLMGERARLLDADYRAKTPGAERLFSALASAVAHNVITAELDYSVKGGRYMVLYLNRLLCPRFYLPLGYGSFRERRLSEILGWIQKLPSHGTARTPQIEQLPV